MATIGKQSSHRLRRVFSLLLIPVIIMTMLTVIHDSNNLLNQKLLIQQSWFQQTSQPPAAAVKPNHVTEDVLRRLVAKLQDMKEVNPEAAAVGAMEASQLPVSKVAHRIDESENIPTSPGENARPSSIPVAADHVSTSPDTDVPSDNAARSTSERSDSSETTDNTEPEMPVQMPKTSSEDSSSTTDEAVVTKPKSEEQDVSATTSSEDETGSSDSETAEPSDRAEPVVEEGDEDSVMSASTSEDAVTSKPKSEEHDVSATTASEGDTESSRPSTTGPSGKAEQAAESGENVSDMPASTTEKAVDSERKSDEQEVSATTASERGTESSDSSTTEPSDKAEHVTEGKQEDNVMPGVPIEPQNAEAETAKSNPTEDKDDGSHESEDDSEEDKESTQNEAIDEDEQSSSDGNVENDDDSTSEDDDEVVQPPVDSEAGKGTGSIEEKYAYILVLTDYEDATAAVMTIESLSQSGTPHEIIVVVMPDIPQSNRELLRVAGAKIHIASPMWCPKYPELKYKCSKLHSIFRALDYTFTKVVYVEAGIFVRKNMDELFEVELKDDEIACVPKQRDLWPQDAPSVLTKSSIGFHEVKGAECDTAVLVTRTSLDMANEYISFLYVEKEKQNATDTIVEVGFFNSIYYPNNLVKYLSPTYNYIAHVEDTYQKPPEQFPVHAVHFQGRYLPWDASVVYVARHHVFGREYVEMRETAYDRMDLKTDDRRKKAMTYAPVPSKPAHVSHHPTVTPQAAEGDAPKEDGTSPIERSQSVQLTSDDENVQPEVAETHQERPEPQASPTPAPVAAGDADDGSDFDSSSSSLLGLTSFDPDQIAAMYQKRPVMKRPPRPSPHPTTSPSPTVTVTPVAWPEYDPDAGEEGSGEEEVILDREDATIHDQLSLRCKTVYKALRSELKFKIETAKEGRVRDDWAYVFVQNGVARIDELHLQVLGLAKTRPRYRTVVLVTEDVPVHYISLLGEVGAEVRSFNKTKLSCERFIPFQIFEQSDLTRMVYIDSGMVPIQNLDWIFGVKSGSSMLNVVRSTEALVSPLSGPLVTKFLGHSTGVYVVEPQDGRFRQAHSHDNLCLDSGYATFLQTHFGKRTVFVDPPASLTEDDPEREVLKQLFTAGSFCLKSTLLSIDSSLSLSVGKYNAPLSHAPKVECKSSAVLHEVVPPLELCKNAHVLLGDAMDLHPEDIASLEQAVDIIQFADDHEKAQMALNVTVVVDYVKNIWSRHTDLLDTDASPFAGKKVVLLYNLKGKEDMLDIKVAPEKYLPEASSVHFLQVPITTLPNIPKPGFSTAFQLAYNLVESHINPTLHNFDVFHPLWEDEEHPHHNRRNIADQETELLIYLYNTDALQLPAQKRDMEHRR